MPRRLHLLSGSSSWHLVPQSISPTNLNDNQLECASRMQTPFARRALFELPIKHLAPMLFAKKDVNEIQGLLPSARG